MIQRGYTIVELIITITIMGILLTLAVVGVNSTLVRARDDERKADIESVQSHLESYYQNGFSRSSVPSITNLITNPSLESNSLTNVSSSSVSVTTSTTWASNGAYSLRLTPNAASTDSFAWIGGCNSGSGVLCLGMQTGKTYTLTARQYIPVTLTGSLEPSRTGIISLWQLAGGVYSSVFSSVNSTAGTRSLSVTMTVAGNATEAFIRLYHGGVTGAGDVYYDSIMLTEGASSYNYADGSTSGWSWSGTVNESASTGPAIYSDGPGSYPGVSLASAGQIDIYLRDVNLQSFVAPGQTDPYVTFIPATNSTQTTAGVTPQPTTSQYVYQPIDSDNALCSTTECRKYNIYYRLEGDNTVYMVTSKNQ